jgi:hypothetical protein
VEGQLHSLRQNDGAVEVDRLKRDRERIEQGKGFNQRLSLGGSGANFLQTGVRDFESNEAWGAEGRIAEAGDDLLALQLIEQQRDNCGRVDDLIGHGLRG